MDLRKPGGFDDYSRDVATGVRRMPFLRRLCAVLVLAGLLLRRNELAAQPPALSTDATCRLLTPLVSPANVPAQPKPSVAKPLPEAVELGQSLNSKIPLFHLQSEQSFQAQLRRE